MIHAILSSVDITSGLEEIAPVEPEALMATVCDALPQQEEGQVAMRPMDLRGLDVLHPWSFHVDTQSQSTPLLTADGISNSNLIVLSPALEPRNTTFEGPHATSGQPLAPLAM